MRPCPYASQHDIGGKKVIVLLYKAMNGLPTPLLGFLELQKTVLVVGEQETFESTQFRISTQKGFILVLVYVDDLLVASHDEREGADFLQKLMGIWKIKLTGKIPGRHHSPRQDRALVFKEQCLAIIVGKKRLQLREQKFSVDVSGWK